MQSQQLALSGTGTPACALTSANLLQAPTTLGPISPSHQDNPSHDSSRISEISVLPISTSANATSQVSSGTGTPACALTSTNHQQAPTTIGPLTSYNTTTRIAYVQRIPLPMNLTP